MNDDAGHDPLGFARRLEERLVFTPGPTEVAEEVRRAMALPVANSDLDPDFARLYRTTCRRLGELMHTSNDVLILAGEGLLGLEAAVASLVEPGDRVLCLANGLYGRGFADFARDWGAEVTLFEADDREPLDAGRLESFLARQPEGFALATLVHCETPTGLLNPVDRLLPVLKRHGILTVMDSVSAIGAAPLESDAWGADVVLGGSQKALSAPPGLAFLSVSPAAWERMRRRRRPVPGVYLNLWRWHEEWLGQGIFPYTPSTSDVYALHEAARRALDEPEGERLARHERLARAMRAAVRAAGLELYPREAAASPSVTAWLVPEPLRPREAELRERLWSGYGVMMAGSWGPAAGLVWRAGHMGENARPEKGERFVAALAALLREAGWPMPGDPLAAYREALTGA
ncbi:MAG: alanine--glyoxylate aminotransferase family protein [Clostridia bacterium]|nr:alanine--glyoxylate aminotransferase family protein [Clostridia bacterium]MCL6521696.1 alanine--glyoxylate aminotransferase family protein [Bacillota bacterium]